MKKNLFIILIFGLFLTGCAVNFSLPKNNINNKPEYSAAVGGCVTAGCSGTLCVEKGRENDIMTTCEWRDEYDCYQFAECEKQTGGQCAWTKNEAFFSCYENKKYSDGEAIDWLAAEYLIKNCRVTMVSQNHQLAVILKLKNGISLKTVEPQIDLVIDEVRAVESNCGPVAIITE